MGDVPFLLAQTHGPLGLDPLVWSFFGTVIVALLGYFGVRAQQQSSSRSAETTLIQVTGSEYRELIKQMRDEMDRMERQLNNHEDRLRNTERELEEWERWGRAMVRWIHNLPEPLREDMPTPPKPFS